MKTKLFTIIFLIIFFNFSFSQQKQEKEEISEIQEVDTSEDEDYEDVPFAIIEEVPTYPGCTGNSQQRKSCMNKRINKHFSKNFNSSIADSLDLPTGNNRLYIMFKISKTGDVIDIRARAPHEALKEEVIKIAKMLPKMKPGKLRGKPVNVSYILPITFTVAPKKSKTEKKQ